MAVTSPGSDGGGGGLPAMMFTEEARILLLLATVASWLLFDVCGYSLISLLANTLILLTTILFLWAKSAHLLNRPPPPIPELQLPREFIEQSAHFIYSSVNSTLSAFHNIALAKDSKLFLEALCFLFMVSLLGSLTDFPTFCYAAIVATLICPPLYKKYEAYIDNYGTMAYAELRMYEMFYERSSTKCFEKTRRWIMEMLEDC